LESDSVRTVLWINGQENELRFVGSACAEVKISNNDFRPSTKRPSIYFWRIWEKSPLKFGFLLVWSSYLSIFAIWEYFFLTPKIKGYFDSEENVFSKDQG